MAEKAYRPKKSHFSDHDRDLIVAECIADSKLSAVKTVANSNKIQPDIIRSWIKKAGLESHEDEKRDTIVQKCIQGEVSPSKLAEINNCDKRAIKKMIKKAGGTLPGKYAETKKKLDKPKKSKLYLSLFFTHK